MTGNSSTDLPEKTDKLAESPLGIASFAIVLVCIILGCPAYFFPVALGAGSIGTFLPLIVALVTGFAMGVWGLAQKGRNKASAIMGVVANGFMLLFAVYMHTP